MIIITLSALTDGSWWNSDIRIIHHSRFFQHDEAIQIIKNWLWCWMMPSSKNSWLNVHHLKKSSSDICKIMKWILSNFTLTDKGDIIYLDSPTENALSCDYFCHHHWSKHVNKRGIPKKSADSSHKKMAESSNNNGTIRQTKKKILYNGAIMRILRGGEEPGVFPLLQIFIFTLSGSLMLPDT